MTPVSVTAIGDEQLMAVLVAATDRDPTLTRCSNGHAYLETPDGPRVVTPTVGYALAAGWLVWRHGRYVLTQDGADWLSPSSREPSQ